MTRADTAKKLAKNTLLYLGLTVAVIAAIPLFAGLAYGVRLLIPLLILAAIVAVVVSPAFRSWFMGEADNATNYHGLAFPTASVWVHPAHAWARLDAGAVGSVGVDSLVATAFGPVTAVRAPEPGDVVRQGQTLFTLSRGERHLEVKAPLSGKVAAVNAQVVQRPALIGESPYGAGWVVSLESADLGNERRALMRGSNMRRWWRGEIDRFMQRLRADGPLATMADGGAVSGDLWRHIDDEKWQEVATSFFWK